MWICWRKGLMGTSSTSAKRIAKSSTTAPVWAGGWLAGKELCRIGPGTACGKQVALVAKASCLLGCCKREAIPPQYWALARSCLGSVVQEVEYYNGASPVVATQTGQGAGACATMTNWENGILSYWGRDWEKAKDRCYQCLQLFEQKIQEDGAFWCAWTLPRGTW